MPILPFTLAASVGTAACLVAAALQPAGRCHDQWPQWSPDGRSIVFSSDRTGDPEVFGLDLSTQTARQLTHTMGRDAHPSFAPDGRLIVFQSPRGDGHTNLYTMKPDGSDPRKITTHEGPNRTESALRSHRQRRGDATDRHRRQEPGCGLVS